MKHNFKELKVWQKSRIVVKFIYNLTKNFPKEEQFGLINQMRRASISISSNIAEGSGHSSNKEFNRFLEISYSSACELETQLILSSDLTFISNEELKDGIEMVEEIQKMLNGLKESLSDCLNSHV